MKWNEVIETEAKWLKERIGAEPDALLRDWFGNRLRILAEVQKMPVCRVHNETCSCGKDHTEDDEETRGFLNFLLSDPTLSMPVGYAAYEPGKEGLHVNDLRKCCPYVEQFPALMDAPVILSTPERIKQVLAVSLHPLKKKLPINTWSFNHVVNLLRDTPACVDAPTWMRIRAIAAKSPTSQLIHFNPPEMRLDDDERPGAIVAFKVHIVFHGPGRPPNSSN